MKMLSRIPMLLPALALAGCAAGGYCEGEQDYERAEIYPPLQTVDGVKLPESQAALRIPPAPATAVAFGERYTDEDGDEAVRCLDKPPAMPVPAAPTPAEAPPAGT